MITIDGLSYRFRGSSRHSLRDVTLSIAAGEFLVVTGPSGCGKSTLALAISGVLSRQYDGEAQGSLTVAGMDALGGQRPIYDVAEVVGLVQQNPESQFCTLTVQDEIAFGLENRCLPAQEIRERIEWALRIVGGQRLAERALATLSGGEKQKVAIAAIMAARPQVLILDEPTSNLDPTATTEVFQVIGRTLRRDRGAMTVIVIEHKVDYLLGFEPRLVVMEAGSIAYDGPADEEHRPHLPVAARDRSVPVRALLSTWGKPTTTAAQAEPVIQSKDLCVSYNGDPVLHSISVDTGPGEFVAVMGDNGSGKTTFLQSLLGLLKPAKGRVVVLGQDTRNIPVSRLARQVGYVFQNPDHQLFADDVLQEATFAPRNLGLLDEATQARIQGLLAHCGLGQRQQDHPYRLSYGEKRRLNLISVLAYAPRLILLDEVLIGQDAANVVFLLSLLRECVEQGATVVMVNHAPEVSRIYASRLIFFEAGKVVVDAPVEQGFQHLADLGYQAYLPRAWSAPQEGLAPTQSGSYAGSGQDGEPSLGIRTDPVGRVTRTGNVSGR